ncbi:hypothetical protein OIU79_028262 [Salix purpurea]|uniref:Secreted protein n=1 Tax=Salix purpurea TaxID=77065 RepID=A0A9Q0VYH7_SALPP|nr:hypothetical protein OIU79_028262 [Salix purpurea]
MGFWAFLEGILLFANSMAILNEDRFPCSKGMDTVRTPRKHKKFTQGADYWARTCLPIHETTAYTSKHHRYHSEAVLWLS